MVSYVLYSSTTIITLLFILSLVSECLAASRYCSAYYNVYGIYKFGFYCPRPGDASSQRYCCGTTSNKYCCSSTSYYPYSSYNIVGTAVGVVFGLVCLVMVVSLVTCCFCAACPLYQRRHHGRIIAAPGPRGMVTTTVTTGTAPMPVAYTHASGNGGQVFMANPQPPPYAPAYPPPAYNPMMTTTTTTNGGYPGYY